MTGIVVLCKYVGHRFFAYHLQIYSRIRDNLTLDFDHNEAINLQNVHCFLICSWICILLWVFFLLSILCSLSVIPGPAMLQLQFQPNVGEGVISWKAHDLKLRIYTKDLSWIRTPLPDLFGIGMKMMVFWQVIWFWFGTSFSSTSVFQFSILEIV